MEIRPEGHSQIETPDHSKPPRISVTNCKMYAEVEHGNSKSGQQEISTWKHPTRRNRCEDEKG